MEALYCCNNYLQAGYKCIVHILVNMAEEKLYKTIDYNILSMYICLRTGMTHCPILIFFYK